MNHEDYDGYEQSFSEILSDEEVLYASLAVFEFLNGKAFFLDTPVHHFVHRRMAIQMQCNAIQRRTSCFADNA